MKVYMPYFVKLSKNKSNEDQLRSLGKKFKGVCASKLQTCFDQVQDIKIDLSDVYIIDKVEIEGEKIPKYKKSEYYKLNRPFYTLISKDGMFVNSIREVLNWFKHPCKRYYTSPDPLMRYFERCSVVSCGDFNPWLKIAKITHIKKLSLPTYLCSTLRSENTLIDHSWWSPCAYSHRGFNEYVRIVKDDNNVYHYDSKFYINNTNESVTTGFSYDTNSLLSKI